MIRKALLLPVLLTGCATGFGEAATGTVDVRLVPAGESSNGVFFESARLGIEEVDLEATEVEEPEDDGHGHAHLESALALEPAGPLGLELLAGEAPLGEQEVPVGDYAFAHVHLAPLGDGCLLGAAGTWEGAGSPVPVRICITTGAEEPATEVAIDLHVELDQTTVLPLGFAVDRLLEGIDVAGLARESDGSIQIDVDSNPGAAAVIRGNLLASFSAP